MIKENLCMTFNEVYKLKCDIEVFTFVKEDYVHFTLI